jgi:hypothetical protein
MYWYTAIPWIIKNPPLHNTTKGICQIDTWNIAENIGIICVAIKDTENICRN